MHKASCLITAGSVSAYRSQEYFSKHDFRSLHWCILNVDKFLTTLSVLKNWDKLNDSISLLRKPKDADPITLKGNFQSCDYNSFVFAIVFFQSCDNNSFVFAIFSFFRVVITTLLNSLFSFLFFFFQSSKSLLFFKMLIWNFA